MLDGPPKGFALRSKIRDAQGNDGRDEAVIINNSEVFRQIVRKD
jgi:hypothetical protein